MFFRSGEVSIGVLPLFHLTAAGQVGEGRPILSSSKTTKNCHLESEREIR
jgi:hypothetical protein